MYMNINQADIQAALKAEEQRKGKIALGIVAFFIFGPIVVGFLLASIIL